MLIRLPNLQFALAARQRVSNVVVDRVLVNQFR